MLPVQNIPEQYLYRLLPQGVVNLDQRKLIDAVLGGYQDRISDLRSYASNLNELVIPDAHLPQLGFNVVLVTFAGPVGQIITRSLDFQEDTPDLTDTVALKAWATDQLQLDDPTQVVSAVAGTDLLRLVDIDSISLLAGNVGAILYSGLHDGESEEVARRTRQQLLQSHFPRLRIKGTADSFEQLGRVLGFDQVAMTPLWSRLVPRLPNDPGNIVDDPDFNSHPEQTPSAQLPDQRYDPRDFKDGEFYTWNSGPLSEDPNSADFWTVAVNKRNPFISLVQLGVVSRPTIGRYVLSGGQSNVVPSVLLDSGTNVSNLRADALAAGTSFNGLKLNVVNFSGTAVGMEITAKLSAIKYRSSYFDMKATILSVGTESIQSSQDLEADPSLNPDGTAVVPFRPWVGGSNVQSVDVYPIVSVGTTTPVLPRSQALGNQVQLSRNDFDDALRISTSLDSMKVATRRIRTRGVGLSIRDDAHFAAYPSEALLFVANATGTYSGFATGKAPSSPKEVEFQAYVGDFKATTFVDETSPGILTITGGDFYGTYRLTDDFYSIAVFPGPFSGGGRMVATFIAEQGTVIRSEPTHQQKADGTIAYTANPEDQINQSGSNVHFWDEMPWRRDQLIAGANVDDDFYIPTVPDVDYKLAVVPYRVLALSGRQYEVAVLDAVQRYQPFRFKIIQNEEIDPITGEPTATTYDRLLLAEDDSRNQYHALLIDDVIVSSQYWSPAKRSDIAQWVPFNEHPLDDVEPYARYATSVDAEVNHNNRLWDAGRGWHLKLDVGNTVNINSATGLGTLFSFAFWINPTQNVGLGAAFTKILDIGGFMAVEVKDNGQNIQFKALQSGVSVVIGSFALSLGWQMVAVRRDGTSISFGLGSLVAPVSWLNFTLDNLDEVTSNDIAVSCGPMSYGIHDLTAWAVRKTDAEFEIIRDPVATKTSVAYPSTWVESLSRDNRYIFKLVESGFAYPAKADIAQARDVPAYAQRYNGFALYEGDPRFKNVGLGDGFPVQPVYPLGFRGPYVEGYGKTLISGSFTPLPGYTEQWGTIPGRIVRVAPPYNSNGGVSTTPTTVASPWPSTTLTNPAQDRAYIKGDDGFVYKIYADDLGSGVTLLAERVLRAREDDSNTPTYVDQPTDAHSVLGAIGKRLSVSVSGTNYTVYEANDAGQTWITPPLYLYRQTQVYIDALASALSRWSNPNSFGQGLGIPALEQNGRLEFTNPESLALGTFQITVDVGNIGTVDDAFAGFSTIVSLTSGSGSVVAQENQVLLVDGKGTNPRGKISFNVDLDSALTGPWLLTIEWNNALSIPRKGQKRQIAIYGYEFRLVAPALYAVTLNPLTMTAVNMSAPLTVRAGGLVGNVNSYGTIATIDHEALIFPEGSDWPLSNLLTTSSWQRRQTLRVSNPKVEPDPSNPTLPTVISMSVVDKLAGTNKSYYNLGDTVVVAGTVSNGSNAQSYTWRFWDSSVETTKSPIIEKIVTPGVGLSYGGTVAMTVVDNIGNSSSRQTVIPINHPPTVSLAVDQNVGIFPYFGSIVATVSDPDGDSVSMKWIENGSQIATGLNLNYKAIAQTTLTARATDSRGGITDRLISFSGNPRQAPVVSPIIRKDIGRISTTNELDFAVYALNPNTGGLLTFKWTFWNNNVPRLFKTGVKDNGQALGDNVVDFHFAIEDNSVNPVYNGNAITLSGSPGVIVSPSPGIDGLSPNRPLGYYDFEMPFALPDGTDLGTVSVLITGTASAYADIYVNGLFVLSHGFDFGQTKSFTLDPTNSVFNLGENVVRFRVVNPTAGAPTYLSISAIVGTMATIGVTTHVANSNVYFNQAHKSLAGSSPGERSVQLVVTDLDGYSTTLQTSVTLINNTPPTITSVTTPSSGALAGTKVSFAATVSDIDQDSSSYTWVFTSPRPLTLLGGNVKYETLDSEVGMTIEGTLIVNDGNGGIATAAIPSVVIADSFLKPLQMSVGPGFYQSGFVQEITSIDTAITIRYSLDGTDIFKDTDGLEYFGPFLISPPEGGVGPVVLKVRAFKANYAPTELVTSTFQFYDPNSLSSSDPSVGTGSSQTNVAVVTVQASGDSVISTATGASIPGDSGTTSANPQTDVPEVSLLDEASQPFAPLPPPGSIVAPTFVPTFPFVKLKSPI